MNPTEPKPVTHKPACNLRKGWPHPCECNCAKLWEITWTTERGQFDIKETVEAETRDKAVSKLYRKRGDICIMSDTASQEKGAAIDAVKEAE